MFDEQNISIIQPSAFLTDQNLKTDPCAPFLLMDLAGCFSCKMSL